MLWERCWSINRKLLFYYLAKAFNPSLPLLELISFFLIWSNFSSEFHSVLLEKERELLIDSLTFWITKIKVLNFNLQRQLHFSYNILTHTHTDFLIYSRFFLWDNNSYLFYSRSYFLILIFKYHYLYHPKRFDPKKRY